MSKSFTTITVEVIKTVPGSHGDVMASCETISKHFLDKDIKAGDHLRWLMALTPKEIYKYIKILSIEREGDSTK